MALSLDKYVFQPLLALGAAEKVDMTVDFVGGFVNWNSTKITDCQASSRWSECIVHGYHLCGQAVGKQKKNDWTSWWGYTVCMYEHQYATGDKLGLECAGLNPRDSNHTCTPEEFNGIASEIAGSCASSNGLDPVQVQHCYDDGAGLTLVKESAKKSIGFPSNAKGYVEPEWIQVNGVSCAEGGWPICSSFFDKTHCEDWDHCDSDAWAKHIASLI